MTVVRYAQYVQYTQDNFKLSHKLSATYLKVIIYTLQEL